MHDIIATNWKKITLFGLGFLVLVGAMITFGVYGTHRAHATQSLGNVTAAEETDMHIDVTIGKVLVDTSNPINIAELEAAAPSNRQQAGTNTTNSNIDVKVDGTPIDVPENGSIHKEITTENGSASIDVSSQSSTSNNSRNRSSINIDVDSSVRIRN